MSQRQVQNTTPPHLIRDGIDCRLIRFGEGPKCPEKFYEDGVQLAHKVFQTLQENSKYSLASFHFGGSFGKKTDVIEPDLDLVVLVNDCCPPMQRFIDNFQNILKSHEDHLQINPGLYQTSERCLKFSFKNGISVDLLPAANVNNLEQQELALLYGLMGLNKKVAYTYSPSFVSNQVAFMKSQDSFTHTLVRLSKFWLKSLHLGERFRAGSMIMELIAVAAAEREAEADEMSVSRAFTRVLSMVDNLDSLKLAFCHKHLDRVVFNSDDESNVSSSEEDDWEWRRVKKGELGLDYADWLIPGIVGRFDILLRTCFLIDPANPFQDYLEDKSESVLSTIGDFARATQSRLDRFLKGRYMNYQDEFIQTLFEPMPENLMEENFGNLNLPEEFLLSYDEPCTSVYNKVKIRNERALLYPEVSRTIKVFKRFLMTVVHSTVKGNPANVSVEDVENAVKNLVKESFQVDLGDAPGWDKHWHYDVMLRIPYVIKDEGYAVCFSMQFNL